MKKNRERDRDRDVDRDKEKKEEAADWVKETKQLRRKTEPEKKL